MKRPLTEIEAFRAQELLIERATSGLDDAQAAELGALGADHDIGFDLAAAAIDIATLRYEELPAGVADKVLVAAGVAPSARQLPTTLAGVAPARTIDTRTANPAQSAAMTLETGLMVPESEAAGGIGPVSRANAAGSVDPSSGAIATGPVPTASPAGGAVIPFQRRSHAPMIAAWAAAAAAFVLAAGAVIWATRKPPEVITKEVPVIQVPVTPSPAEARAELLASARDVTRIDWAPTADAAATGASGDVVWSPSRQRGYMRFVGLAPNDPTKVQYQLWIFDRLRDERFPVDGGVFDVGGNGEVVVAISAKLAVADPSLFAVTVEAPGGVVVSKRERIVVTATPGRPG